MSTTNPTADLSYLDAYGVPRDRVCSLLGEASAESLNFLDLYRLPIAPKNSDDAVRPDAVLATDSGAILYVVDEQRLFSGGNFHQTRFERLRTKLASRGSHGYLARLRPGELVVMPITLGAKAPDPLTIRADTPDARSFYGALTSGFLPKTGSARSSSDHVFESMFKLVWSVADRLSKLRIKRTDVLSLVGRALFFRFLKDRDIVRERDLKKILPEAKSLLEAFDTPKNASATCRWLDKTFNGDLLPLSDSSEDFFSKLGRRTGDRLFVHLRAIIEGIEPVGDDNYQHPIPLDFGDFDFAHVPVGLLSQVYERLAWIWEHDTARSTSVHYTPRQIAQMMVNDAFDGLPDAAHSRVLDPSCGASVFLVLAFRRLYQEHWKASGKRPQTAEIRRILEKQIVGFDINESAIRLASLSLYLTAIELDPDPSPPEKLHFKPLRDRVLFNFRQADEEAIKGAIAGSLGDRVPKAFDGAFDLVIGNPPWTSLSKKETPLAKEFDELSKRIIKERGTEKLSQAYTNPDRTPDLPFIWKSTEWCKPDGRIVLALPASILLKQERIPAKARETLFRLIEVNGIINGTNLSDTKVWENMNQPFFMLFATNRIPSEAHQLRMITPYFDEKLNRRGLFRIDSKSSQWITPSDTFKHPWRWKALSLGTSLDVDVTKKILDQELPTVSEYWEEHLGLVSGRGYDVEGSPQKSASFLEGKLNLVNVPNGQFRIETSELIPFQRETLYRSKAPEIYKAPLFLLKQAPGADRSEGRGLFSDEDVAYSRSFHGYSGFGATNGEELVRYLQLFAHSEMMIYFALCTKARFGSERRVLDKADFDDTPIVPYDSLTSNQQSIATQLSERLMDGDDSVFPEIDTFFAKLYGLDALDLTVIRDTVETAMPFQVARRRACNPPSKKDTKRFTSALQKTLQPFFAIAEENLEVISLDEFAQTSIYETPFRFLLLQRQGDKTTLPPELIQTTVLEFAEESGATRIIHHLPDALLVGLFNQYRYWTPSRARLLAAEIAREHLTVFDH